MEQDYIDIEAIIRRANQQRNEAVGELLSVGFRQCWQLLAHGFWHLVPGRVGMPAHR